jgi:uncharacterized protein YbjT (DUF2867 family)
MKVLVTGGTGTVGSAVVKALQGKADISVLTRDPEKAKKLPAGVRGVIGNLLDVGTIRSAFKGYDAVFLVTVVSPSESTEGLLALNGIRDSGVKKVVYLSVQDADVAVHLPHFGSKVPVEMAIRASGLAHTILRPNNFYQNDTWYQQALMNYGVYPQPLGNAGVSRVDVRDIADAAVVALTTSKLDGKTINLVGPDALTGPGTADTWSKALGKSVSYGGEDMEAWEKQNLSYGIPPVLAYDFRLMYEWFQQKGLKASQKDVTELTAVLGHAPRRYADYVSEMVKGWKS